MRVPDIKDLKGGRRERAREDTRHRSRTGQDAGGRLQVAGGSGSSRRLGAQQEAAGIRVG